MKVEIKNQKLYNSLSDDEKVEFVANLIRSEIRQCNDRGDFRFMSMEDWSDNDLWSLFLSAETDTNVQPEDPEIGAQILSDREWNSQ